jgi:hypothetical protein
VDSRLETVLGRKLLSGPSTTPLMKLVTRDEMVFVAVLVSSNS